MLYLAEGATTGLRLSHRSGTFYSAKEGGEPGTRAAGAEPLTIDCL